MKYIFQYVYVIESDSFPCCQKQNNLPLRWISVGLEVKPYKIAPWFPKYMFLWLDVFQRMLPPPSHICIAHTVTGKYLLESEWVRGIFHTQSIQ